MSWKSLLRSLRRSLVSLLLGLLLVGLGFWGHFLFHGPELKPWHLAILDEEFTAQAYSSGAVTSLAQYRELEARLFDEVQRKVYAKTGAADRLPYNRYNAGSGSDPGTWPQNWNHTFILEPAGEPVGGVLLLHGLTDSPYSMRSIGLMLAAQGFKVVGLRLPGHGTVPAGLVRAELEDFEAATQMAMRDLRKQVGANRPLYAMGYSNGAALAVNYSLDALADPALPMPAGLVLISPAIGITKLAVIGRMRLGVSDIPGFGRVAWQDIDPEIDPYKYMSFSFHGGGITQRLTRRISSRIAKLAESRPLQGLPPILVFASTVDSTVLMPAVVHSLLGKLAPQGHELVLFDINRLSVVQPLLVADPAPLTASILKLPHRPFALTLITNANEESFGVVARQMQAESTAVSERPLELAWPRTVFSLSHVALPFPPDDPLYGYAAAPDAQHIQLGRLEIRGENGVLNVPGWLLTRQRSNPFHAFMMERIAQFVHVPSHAAAAER